MLREVGDQLKGFIFYIPMGVKLILQAVSFSKPLQATNTLYVCSALNSSSNSCSSTNLDYTPNTWFNLRIRQQQNAAGNYIFEVLIDNDVKRTKTNRNPLTFENVNGIIGHPYDRGFKIAKGRYRNFEFNSNA